MQPVGLGNTRISTDCAPKSLETLHSCVTVKPPHPAQSTPGASERFYLSSCSMIGENRQVVADEPVEFEK